MDRSTVERIVTGKILPCSIYDATSIKQSCNGQSKSNVHAIVDAASYTLLQFASDPKYLGAQPGIIAVLHTWGQQLSFHPHIHCIVSGGGVDKDKRWKEAVKAKHKFLLPTKAVQQVYRPYFLKQLQQQIDKGIITMTEEQHKDWLRLRSALYDMDWIVDFREPMGGPAQVLEYLGRYTHKVAISNHRIKRIDLDNNVPLSIKIMLMKAGKSQ